MTAIAMRKLSGINCFLLGIVRHIALNKSLSNNECNNFGSACDSYIVLIRYYLWYFPKRAARLAQEAGCPRGVGVVIVVRVTDLIQITEVFEIVVVGCFNQWHEVFYRGRAANPVEYLSATVVQYHHAEILRQLGCPQGMRIVKCGNIAQ